MPNPSQLKRERILAFLLKIKNNIWCIRRIEHAYCKTEIFWRVLWDYLISLKRKAILL